MEIRSTRDLRAFLAETMIKVRDGDVDHQSANAISKLCAQVNNSLAIEVKAAISSGVSLEASTPEEPASAPPVPALTNHPVDTSPQSEDFPEDFPDDLLDGLPAEQDVWCDQCDGLVKVSEARSCKSKFCKAGAS